ncbi:D-alanyl-D-alanine carboxypeptidase/D-alanyl-D-alanine endopeptidase [Peristeroidobacter soli]|jgi:D-alanyl-D-alanine carboxypeptidase/D-alanyl-D-alanine-endopeptidase (penicillin-binding protein 4)|uniref:D-alanyl-D-alanine carboxypeptidase/D-alanyl-D-alanine endopeptidase n=1 Tax=Peristeroidobacter soli TaxID=2497877 RepID=UPI00101DBC29|nr:D-alanyl-D-alanine carboxypeptidase/D-alanyl-D-alanine-endopeptidase [Peristeroidobacter soli]
MLKPLVALAALVAVAFHPLALARDSQLPPAVLRVMNNVGIPAKGVSIYVRDANTNEVVLGINDNQPRSPASVIKVLTTYVALDSLGPSYTWKTRAYANGALANGVLNGDLFVVGGGDPYMTSEHWWRFVQSLREQGLAKITGDFVVDHSFFAPAEGNRGEFDSQPFRSYNVLPDALMVNFQTSRFTLITNEQRGRPLILVNPLPVNLDLQNQVRLVSGKCYTSGVTFSTPDPIDHPNTVVVGGTLPTSCGTYTIGRAIMTAPDYAYGTFRTLWTQSGGAMDGEMRIETLPASARLIYEHDSISLAEIIRLVNKYSNNVMARHLMLTLGVEKYGPPATVESGRNAVRQWLTNRGINMPGFVLDNGSGLSRAERVTARGLGEMLDMAWHSPFMPEFAASLPLSATDGTLRNRFKSPGMQGRIRLKTGHLDNVSALAGFVNAASGKTYVVVIMVNHPGAQGGAGEAVHAELIRWVFGQ